MRDYQTKANQDALPDSITAEKLGAGEANSILTESKTAVSSSGQALAPADGTAEVTDQLAKALAIYGGGGAEYHLDTGAVNAYVLNPVSPKKSAPAYFDGMTVSFKPGNDNNGASTINVASLGVKSITDIDGNALAGGKLGKFATLIFNVSGDRFELHPASLALYNAYLKFTDVKSNASNGGSSIVGTQLRDLNTEDADTAGIGSVAANQITLKPGTYKTTFICPAYISSDHRAHLYDVTGAAVLVLGYSASSGSTDITQTNAIGSGVFTIGVESVIELRHYTSVATASTGLGNNGNIGDGFNTIYSSVELWRLN